MMVWLVQGENGRRGMKELLVRLWEGGWQKVTWFVVELVGLIDGVVSDKRCQIAWEMLWGWSIIVKRNDCCCGCGCGGWMNFQSWNRWCLFVCVHWKKIGYGWALYVGERALMSGCCGLWGINWSRWHDVVSHLNSWVGNIMLYPIWKVGWGILCIPNPFKRMDGGCGLVVPLLVENICCWLCCVIGYVVLRGSVLCWGVVVQ